MVRVYYDGGCGSGFLLKNEGISVILISHRLNDIFEVSDRIVVLRQGQIVTEKIKSDTSMNQIVSYIVGAE